MCNRMKQMRENKGIIQAIMAHKLGVIQQTLSRYENDITCIKADVLIKAAKCFNVSTDYLLGLSEIKRDMSMQKKMDNKIEEYYELVEVYSSLDEIDQKLFWNILQSVKNAQEKRNKEEK